MSTRCAYSRCAAETERGRYEARLEYANAELQKEITRRQVIEAELITARQLAEATNQAKNGFISNLRHALRTPVNGIIDHTQLLQKNSALLGLEWIECGRSDADALASPADVCVPILATQLHDLAQRGDVLNLTALAERMLAQDPAAAAMLARLQSLAAQFDMRGMCELPAAQLASTSSAAGERAPVG